MGLSEEPHEAWREPEGRRGGKKGCREEAVAWEKGAWCVQELERKPVHLYTHTCTCTLTHAYVFHHPLDTEVSPSIF